MRISHECSCFVEFIKQVGEKRSNARLAEHFFYLFFAASLINLIIQSTHIRFYLSYDIHIHIIFKSYFWRENVRVLTYA